MSEPVKVSVTLEWQPIETGPRYSETGICPTPSMHITQKSGPVVVCDDANGDALYMVWYRYSGGIRKATHWMPLPAPPNDTPRTET